MFLLSPQKNKRSYIKLLLIFQCHVGISFQNYKSKPVGVTLNSMFLIIMLDEYKYCDMHGKMCRN